MFVLGFDSSEISSYIHLRKFAGELLLLLEEFRLIDAIMKERPGTVTAFETRKEAYVSFHRNGISANMQKSFLADALMHAIFIALHEGMYSESSIDWGPIDFELIKSVLQNAYDQKVRKTIRISLTRIIGIIERSIDNDLIHQYYSAG